MRRVDKDKEQKITNTKQCDVCKTYFFDYEFKDHLVMAHPENMIKEKK